MGEGAPLLLLHQAPMTSGQFDLVYAPLAARGFQAIGIDMPGFGLSDPVPGTPTVTDFAQAVPVVLDALGLPSAFLLGHHTGGLAATEAALAFPERIDALIVNGPLLVTKEDREDFLNGLHQKERNFTALPHAAHIVGYFDIRDQMAQGTVPPSRLSDYVVQALTGRGAYWHGHYAAFMYDQEEPLSRVTQPTLILTNTGDMIYDHALKARSLFPHFAFAELEGGGVDIVDQQSEAWCDAVAAFLHSTVAANS